MSKLVNWGRWLVAALVIFWALSSIRATTQEVAQIHGEYPFDQLLRILLLCLLDIGFYSYLVWGLWRSSGLTYWLLVVLNCLYFVSFGLKFISGHFQELTPQKWAYLAATVFMLVWLALPSVYDEYWRRKHPA